MQDFKMPFSEKTASIGISFDVPNKKEILSNKANASEICGSEKCRKEQHRLKTISVRKKNKGYPIKDFYSTFFNNCSNLRRKLAKNSTAREKFDIEFAKIRTEALKMKKGLSEDSPKQSIYEYSEFLRVKENDTGCCGSELYAGLVNGCPCVYCSDENIFGYYTPLPICGKEQMASTFSGIVFNKNKIIYVGDHVFIAFKANI